MIHAAGILFVDKDRNALFLKRGRGGDHAGEWCFPGGTTEADETPEQTAVRETREEIGRLPRGERAMLTRSIAIAAPPVAVMPAAPAPSPLQAGAGGGSATIAQVLQAVNAEADDDLIEPVEPEKVCFTTFLQSVERQFEIELNEEHVGFAWAPLSSPPEPLHPGCRTAINRMEMDELGVARAIVAGELTSPQRYHNVTLFAIRITGTGVSYRNKLDEFVWRDPAVYLNDDFLARCNGLPVIFEHPKRHQLNSQEFADRKVGTVFLPYIRGDEVWAVAKIYDDAAIKIMTDGQLSTSPCVVLRDGDNAKVELDDGRVLLIEGKPALLDHIAICEQGVWDKGGEPTGVINDSAGEVLMTEEERRAAEAARADSVESDSAKLDKILGILGPLSSRVDSVEVGHAALIASIEGLSARADASRKDDDDEDEKAKMAKADEDEDEEKAKADKARKDSEDEEKDKAKADDDDDKEPKEMADSTARADAAAAHKLATDVRKMVQDVARTVPKHLGDADYAALSGRQAKADRVFQAFGDAAPRPLQGEDLNAYRRRLATDLKVHSVRLKDIDLMAVGDSVAFDVFEEQIYADAMEAAVNPRNLAQGELRTLRHTDPATGRITTSFHGEPISWMADMAGQRRQLVGINKNPDTHA